jgi:predicted GNAT family acetyltransferase
MTLATTTHEATTKIPYLPNRDANITVERLRQGDQAEVLEFLAERPLHTVIIAGWIRDNGLVSPLNRGTFYGCRNSQGELEGVALIGHVTLLETRTERALEAFAHIAQDYSGTHLLMGEQERIREFWDSYSGDGQPVRRACRETLFELLSPVAEKERVEGLRSATLSDLHLVIPVQAEMAFEESGIDPREADPEGFRERCARRIEQGRIWLLLEEGELIFKADIIGETPDVFYLEGVYVAPIARRRGLGTRCMAQLSNQLLAQTQSICLLVNEQNQTAHSFYRKVGFQERGTYDTIFLRKNRPATSLATENGINQSTEVRPLTELNKAEVLEFLSEHPARTIIMAGLIHDNGIESPLNRGTFYGYWNQRGVLDGVALIGRNTLFEARSDEAVRAFAEVARDQKSIKMLMGESEELEKFWDCYRADGQQPRLRCQEVLYECDRASDLTSNAIKLRRATIKELDEVVKAQAEMVLQETGVNPLETDPEDFRERCARRIKRKRVWVLMKEGTLLFKADLLAETPRSAYLEGLWVKPSHRHQGYGRGSFLALSRAMLAQKTSFAGFVDSTNLRAQTFYERVGCSVRARLGKIYL